MTSALATPLPPAARPAGSTLERRLGELLAEARELGEAHCPLCGCEMTPSGAEARCNGCGTRLS